MKNNNNDNNNNNNENAIKIVVGDESVLNISEVNDYMNDLRPRKIDNTNLIIPVPKKKIEKTKKVAKKKKKINKTTKKEIEK